MQDHIAKRFNRCFFTLISVSNFYMIPSPKLIITDESMVMLCIRFPQNQDPNSKGVNSTAAWSEWSNCNSNDPILYSNRSESVRVNQKLRNYRIRFQKIKANWKKANTSFHRPIKTLLVKNVLNKPYESPFKAI